MYNSNKIFISKGGMERIPSDVFVEESMERIPSDVFVEELSVEEQLFELKSEVNTLKSLLLTIIRDIYQVRLS